jgi:heme/copper-type cytochrome/quinol oxidase subunit 2
MKVVDTAGRFWHVFDVYWPIAVAVFVVVVGALIGVGLRFRSDSDEFPGGRSEWPALEYSWMGLVAAIAAFLLYVTFATMDAESGVVGNVNTAKPGVPRGALVIRVTAAQWSWRFDYPGGASVSGDQDHWPTLVVPTGRAVHFDITSEDVVHSFWVAERRVKVDAFPGRTTTANLIWPSAGSWLQDGRCNQYCGLDHTTMNFDVRALPAASFAAWLRSRGGSA